MSIYQNAVLSSGLRKEAGVKEALQRLLTLGNRIPGVQRLLGQPKSSLKAGVSRFTAKMNANKAAIDSHGRKIAEKLSGVKKSKPSLKENIGKFTDKMNANKETIAAKGRSVSDKLNAGSMGAGDVSTGKAAKLIDAGIKIGGAGLVGGATAKAIDEASDYYYNDAMNNLNQATANENISRNLLKYQKLQELKRQGAIAAGLTGGGGLLGAGAGALIAGEGNRLLGGTVGGIAGLGAGYGAYRIAKYLDLV